MRGLRRGRTRDNKAYSKVYKTEYKSVTYLSATMVTMSIQ